MVKTILKIMVGTYIAALVISFAFFPRTALGGLRNGHPQVLLMPAMLPIVARTYWQFLHHGTWPFGRDPSLENAADLVEGRGKDVLPGVRTVTLDMTPELPPGKEGRLLYSIGRENFYITRTGAFVEAPTPGALVRVGQYFCFSQPRRSLFSAMTAKVECARLFRRKSAYEWQRLGQSKGAIGIVSKD